MQTLLWLPRILTVLLIGFFALFAFAAEGFVGVLMQLIPCLLLGAALWVSWQKPWVGFGAFLTLSALFTFFFQTYNNLLTLLSVTVMLCAVSMLHLLYAVLAAKHPRKEARY